jgi:hypothetical protein
MIKKKQRRPRLAGHLEELVAGNVESVVLAPAWLAPADSFSYDTIDALLLMAMLYLLSFR